MPVRKYHGLRRISEVPVQSIIRDGLRKGRGPASRMRSGFPSTFSYCFTISSAEYGLGCPCRFAEVVEMGLPNFSTSCIANGYEEMRTPMVGDCPSTDSAFGTMNSGLGISFRAGRISVRGPGRNSCARVSARSFHSTYCFASCIVEKSALTGWPAGLCFTANNLSTALRLRRSQARP